MFSTIDQFSNLANHNVEGMQTLLTNFDTVLGNLKGKPTAADLFQLIHRSA